MAQLTPIIISGAIGILSAIIAILVKRYYENRNKILATKREQLEKIFAPLEVLSKVNKRQFDRFVGKPKPPEDERDYIEQSIWHPNLLEIRNIIMANAHLLTKMPEVFLKLLDHINLWLFAYEEKYTKKTKTGPVFAGPGGQPYPKEADEYIFAKATEFRKILNK